MNALRSLAFAALSALAFASCSSLPPQSSAATEPATVLLVSIDGFRADFLDRGITPHLSRVAREGVHAKWMNPSYPSLTFPNHYTPVTGLRPDRHGIVHNTMRDPELGDFSLQLRDAIADGRWWGGEPIWIGAERAGLRTATLFWPGSEAAIDGVRPTRWTPYDGNMSMQQRVDTVLGWLSEPATTRPRLATLYFDALDHTGHDFGPESVQTSARDFGVILAIETHFEFTSFELLRLFEMCGAVPGEYLGICLDTMNLLTMLEDPVLAGRRLLPWTVTTHITDGGLLVTEDGLVSFTAEAGKGVVDLAAIFELLASVHPQITLTVEDHGGDFGITVHDAEFLARFPDLTVSELVRLLKLAARTRTLHEAGKLSVLPRDRWPAVCEGRVKRDIQAVRRITSGAAK